ncbi:MAG: hypothetical protein IPJ34_01245 [Myxococcales bacterium]|nr:hypothetical protein [Myxococcales bacterium]
MPDAAPKTSASVSVTAQPKEPSFVMTPPSVLQPQPKAAVAVPAPTATVVTPPTETVERPMPRTLARGRYEAKPATIWIVVALGVVFALLFVLGRIRSARRAKERRLAALTDAVKRAPTARA